MTVHCVIAGALDREQVFATTDLNGGRGIMCKSEDSRSQQGK